MPQDNPVQQAQAMTEALKQVGKNYNQMDERVQQFCQTCESQLQQLSSSLQKVEQEGQNFEGDVDQSLKQLEQEAVQNQGVWAVLAPGNKYAQKEQVGQKRLALLKIAKKLRQTMQEASSELSLMVKQFQDDTRQLQNDFTPLKQDFQTLAKSLDQLHNNLKTQQDQGKIGGQIAVVPAPVSQGEAQGQRGTVSAQPQAEQMPGLGLDPQDRQVVAGLQQAMGELSLAQQHLGQSQQQLHRLSQQAGTAGGQKQPQESDWQQMASQQKQQQQVQPVDTAGGQNQPQESDWQQIANQQKQQQQVQPVDTAGGQIFRPLFPWLYFRRRPRRRIWAVACTVMGTVGNSPCQSISFQ